MSLNHRKGLHIYIYVVCTKLTLPVSSYMTDKILRERIIIAVAAVNVMPLAV